MDPWLARRRMTKIVRDDYRVCVYRIKNPNYRSRKEITELLRNFEELVAYYEDVIGYENSKIAKEVVKKLRSLVSSIPSSNGVKWDEKLLKKWLEIANELPDIT